MPFTFIAHFLRSTKKLIKANIKNFSPIVILWKEFISEKIQMRFLFQMNFFNTYPILVPIVSLVVAEVMKLIITTVHERKIEWNDFARSGGMPSGHSTVAASIAMTALIVSGPDSMIFAVSAVFALLVVYDAVKLRWEAGKHAKVLNYLIGEKKLEERLGHTFLEMLAGIFLGVGISILLLAL